MWNRDICPLLENTAVTDVRSGVWGVWRWALGFRGPVSIYSALFGPLPCVLALDVDVESITYMATEPPTLSF